MPTRAAPHSRRAQARPAAIAHHARAPSRHPATSMTPRMPRAGTSRSLSNRKPVIHMLARNRTVRESQAGLDVLGFQCRVLPQDRSSTVAANRPRTGSACVLRLWIASACGACCSMARIPRRLSLLTGRGSIACVNAPTDGRRRRSQAGSFCRKRADRDAEEPGTGRRHRAVPPGAQRAASAHRPGTC